MTEPLYTTKANVTGGRANGHGLSLILGSDWWYELNASPES